MADPEFEKLVQQFAERQQKADSEQVVDWEEMKKWWVKTVRDLFNEIEEWLQTLIQSGSVKPLRQTLVLMEEDLGQYEIESLTLQLASRELKFKPLGTMLIGAFGRIDVIGPNGKAVLLLVNTDETVPLKERRAHVGWFISAPKPDVRPSMMRPDLRPLTRESFQLLFTDLFGINP